MSWGHQQWDPQNPFSAPSAFSVVVGLHLKLCQLESFRGAPRGALSENPALFLQAADHGRPELADRGTVSAIRSTAIPGELRATADPDPAAARAALPAVHAAALPGAARPAAGTHTLSL